jgi:hypothetical protein
MYKSIQYFYENITEKIHKRIVNQVKEGEDIGQISNGIRKDLLELGTHIISEILEDMDKELRESEERKMKYEVVHKRCNSFMTRMGKVTYERTCFKRVKTESCEYIVDGIFGIKAHENIASDVEKELINEAVQTSYRKSGEEAIGTSDELSKQTVMNYISKYDFDFPEEEEDMGERKKCRIIYIEADEDHVPLQKGGIAMPRLVYVHEGVENENTKSKRRKLRNARYFSSLNESNAVLWERVLDYIYGRYDWDSIERIYIAGDGASWIRAGTKMIDRSRFVLDRYHLKKYMKQASAHMDDIMQKTLKDALYDADKASVKAILGKIIEMTEEESRKEGVIEASGYILSNWDGIQVYDDERGDVIGCSAEGHVSHIYSNRLSSRPKGWSIKNVKNMAKLAVYRMNGGNILDLVKYRRKKEEEQQQVEKHKDKTEMIRGIRNEFYKNVQMPVLTQGKRTQTSWLLKEIRGVC